MKTIYKLSMNGCQPCKQYEPTFKKVAKEFPEYCWAEVNVEEELGAKLASQFKIRSVPATIIIVGDTREYCFTSEHVKTGIMTEQELRDFVNA